MINDGPSNGQNVSVPNLTKYGIPTDVRCKAIQIYDNHMRVNLKKGIKRKELDFYLIYCAYKELGILVEPRNIAHLVGISDKSIGKAHSTFSAISTGYKPPIVIGTAPMIIPELCAKIGSIEPAVIKEIRDLCIRSLETHPEFCEYSPQKLAAAFIHTYLEHNNYKVNRQLLCSLVNVTEGTLITIVKIVRSTIEQS
jgi:transcription initiation factor TFIIIB Brf1 subunit/transcription initiation factor TFIIB